MSPLRVRRSRSAWTSDARGIPDDDDRGEPTTLALGPLGQEALDDEVEALVRGCGWFGEVVVELAERHRSENRFRHRAVTPTDQQSALCRGVQVPGSPQQLGADHVGHPLAGQHERHGPVAVPALPQAAQRTGWRRLAPHVVVARVALAQLVLQRGEIRVVVVNGDDRRSVVASPDRWIIRGHVVTQEQFVDVSLHAVLSGVFLASWRPRPGGLGCAGSGGCRCDSESPSDDVSRHVEQGGVAA